MPIGRIDQIDLDRQIIVDESGRLGVVRVDATNLRRCDEHIVRIFRTEKSIDRGAVAQIQFGSRPCNDIRVPRMVQRTADGRPDQTAVSSNVNTCLFVDFSHSRLPIENAGAAYPAGMNSGMISEERGQTTTSSNRLESVVGSEEEDNSELPPLEATC